MTQKYYSELGGANFRMSHMGHNVREGPLQSGEPAQRKVPAPEQVHAPKEEAGGRVFETPSTPNPIPEQDLPGRVSDMLSIPKPTQEQDIAGRISDTLFTPATTQELSVDIPTVQVDIVLRAHEENPSFRVWGIKADRTDAFKLFFPVERTEEMKRILEMHQYMRDEGGEKVLFTWEEGAVEISNGLKAKIYSPPTHSSPILRIPEEEAESTTEEIPVEKRVVKQVEKPVEAKQQVEVKRPVEVKPVPEKKPREVPQPAQVAPVLVTPPVVAERITEGPPEKIAEKPTETSAPALPPKKEQKQAEEEGPLLLAKSSYLQDGEEVRKEAVLVSKMLREFRWNVEPAYMIGVMLDGNLSIETNTGVISRTLIKRIENLGYSLIAINVSRERPTAWFKRKTPQPHTTRTDASRLRELERRVDEQTRMLDDERRHFDDERAGWQQRFTLLKRLMASMGESAPSEEVGVDSADSEPEPDLAS
jgi:hypothetical protein